MWGLFDVKYLVRMERIKENQELSNEFNHPVKNEIKPESLERGLSGEDEGSELVLAIKTERGFDKGGNFEEGN